MEGSLRVHCASVHAHAVTVRGAIGDTSVDLHIYTMASDSLMSLLPDYLVHCITIVVPKYKGKK